MYVMKFGGASVRDAAAVRNVGQIIANYASHALVVVVSAIDKTTNNLELLARHATEGNEKETRLQFAFVRDFHHSIMRELFVSAEHPAFARVDAFLHELDRVVQGVLLLGEFPPRIYDRIMACGELMSSVILHEYLLQAGHSAHWHDARCIIATDNSHQQAQVVWHLTRAAVQAHIQPLARPGQPVVIQGYIASNTEGRTTTLGREGSDYTAAILATCLDAQRVIIWKDVPGVMSADPKQDPSYAKKIDALSYESAVEMTFYGASVIHPKTIKPLRNQDIPLYVKSFNDMQAEGTTITPASTHTQTLPSRLHKHNQALVVLQPRDFSFMDEQLLRLVFEACSHAGVQVNLVQTAAISATLCVDHHAEQLQTLSSRLTDAFEVTLTEGLRLTTLLYHGGMLPADAAHSLLLQRDANHLHWVTKAE